MKVLISGFEAFDSYGSNPSEQVVRLLLKHDMPFELKGVVLPVCFSTVFSILKEQIDSFQPDYVVGIGLAGKRDELTVERVAINLVEARIPDNKGFQPVGEEVAPNQEDGLFSRLPIKSMLRRCQNAGIKSSISNTAGTYVCNYLMYKIVSYGIESMYKGGFIHVPPTPEIDPSSETMKLSDIEKGVAQMLIALGDPEENHIQVNTGVEC